MQSGLKILSAHGAFDDNAPLMPSLREAFVCLLRDHSAAAVCQARRVPYLVDVGAI